MSDEHDSWVNSAFGFDIGGAVNKIEDAGSAVVSQVASAVAEVTSSAPPAFAMSEEGQDAVTASGVVGSLASAASSVGGAIASAASSVGSAVSSGASKALDAAQAAGSVVVEDQKQIWSASEGVYDAVTGAYDSVAPNFTQDNRDLGTAVDGAEAAGRKVNDAEVAKYGDTPVLGTAVKAGAWFNNTLTEAAGGVVKGVGDLGATLGNNFFHPIDAATSLGEGALDIAEHVPSVPGTGTIAKGVHGLVDLARGKTDGKYGATLGDLGQNLLDDTQQDPNDPSQRVNTDVAFVAGVGGGTKAWKQKPAEAAARTVTNIVPMLLGDEAAGGAEPPPELPPTEPLPPTLKTPYLPEGVPAPPAFNPDIPTYGPGELPAGPKVVNPGGGRVSINHQHPFYAAEGIDTVPVRGPEPSLPPDTLPDPQSGPKQPGEPITPEPAPKLPGGPKEGPPIPREDPVSRPGDTVRQPMDIPGVEAEPIPSTTRPQPSTLPEGPATQDAPSSQGSAVSTERGLGGVPAIPRGMDPGALIALMLDTPGAKSVVELMQELGMPIERR